MPHNLTTTGVLNININLSATDVAAALSILTVLICSSKVGMMRNSTFHIREERKMYIYYINVPDLAGFRKTDQYWSIFPLLLYEFK